MVKKLAAVQETWVQFLGWEDSLEAEMATHSRASLVAQMVKNLPTMQETWVQFLGWEDPLEKGMPTCSSILAEEFHGQRSLPGYIQSMWLQRAGHD